jgi:hypothetical protein
MDLMNKSLNAASVLEIAVTHAQRFAPGRHVEQSGRDFERGKWS